MPSISTNHVVAHPADALHQIVLDVEKYPEFLPLCLRTTELGRQTSHDGVTILFEMEVGFGPLREAYTTEIIAERDSRLIRLRSNNGPFNSLKAVWRFTELSRRSTKVTFQVTYELRSIFLSAAVGRVFDRVFGHIVQAFTERADAILPSAAEHQKVGSGKGHRHSRCR